MQAIHLGVLRRHYQWDAAESITEQLKSAGFQALLAGGCVRDGLLGRRPNDIDVATSATPEQVEALFAKTIAVGKQFGVIRVIESGCEIEVATFRKDGLYVDGRRPETVEFSSPEEDAQRRDFTVNALFYDIQENKVFDFVGGIKDLEEGVIRTVGLAHQRFSEDHLRILRAVRFVSQLGFYIEDSTMSAMQKLSYKVASVSGERLQDEMRKFFKGSFRVSALALFKASGLDQQIFPGYQFPEFLDIPTKHFWQGLSIYLREVPTRDQLEKYLSALKFSTGDKKNILHCWDQLRAPQMLWDLEPGARLIAYSDPALRFACQVWAFQGMFIEEISALEAWWVRLGEKLPEPLLRGDDLKMHFQGSELGARLQKSFQLQLENPQFSKQELMRKVLTN